MLVLAGTANALHVDAFTPDLEKITQFVRDISPLMNKPLSWCDMKETGRYEDYGSSIKIHVNISCDNTKVNKVLKQLYIKYHQYLTNTDYIPVIDSAFDDNFPMYHIVWENIHENSGNFALNIQPKSSYMEQVKSGWDGKLIKQTGDMNKYLYFQVVINGRNSESVYFIPMGGSTLYYCLGGDAKESYSYKTDIYVKKPYVKNASLDITYSRLYQFEEYEDMINATRLD